MMISVRYSFNVHSFNAVSQMQAGVDPTTALQKAMAPIIKFYPSFHGAMIAVNMDGKYGMHMNSFLKISIKPFNTNRYRTIVYPKNIFINLTQVLL